jgi:hypothetical protein
LGLALATNSGVSALYFLYGIEKSHPADALIIAEFAVDDIKDIK